LLELQQGTQLRNRHVFSDHRLDLVEREPEILVGQDPVQAREPVEFIVAVSGAGVDPERFEQAQVVGMAQGRDGYSCRAREIADTQHDAVPYGPGVRVRSRDGINIHSPVA
jgi:hypothetical protein